MKRRTFLVSTAALTLLPLALQAAEPLLYTPGSAEAAMDEGKIVLLDFWASWCSTCAAQERVLAALKAENPTYEEKIVFYKVDWDLYAKETLAKDLRIPRRSTLVLLKGRKELGRIVAGTSKADIQALLDMALTAS
ncbi:MAG: thioredoxin family protein [Tabrizicola sp.]|uniref:thioredoxin family protein n=1 Tax=Tabrizicola sp. TaxID=2005166 RepID=UPI002ABB0EDB|nr:thioredoxin family protein [Tabrizicola sp.]MDZ4087098.1 thioredoxin family protein [Tabrizicola sp.]